MAPIQREIARLAGFQSHSGAALLPAVGQGLRQQGAAYAAALLVAGHTNKFDQGEGRGAEMPFEAFDQ